MSVNNADTECFLDKRIIFYQRRESGTTIQTNDKESSQKRKCNKKKRKQIKKTHPSFNKAQNANPYVNLIYNLLKKLPLKNPVEMHRRIFYPKVSQHSSTTHKRCRSSTFEGQIQHSPTPAARP